MKRTMCICGLIALFATICFSQEKDLPEVKAATLSDSLKILQPLVDKQWVGKLANPQDGRLLEVRRHFQVIWGGSIVKYSTSMQEIGSFSEGYFYWDREVRQVAVFIVNSRGVIQEGGVSLENGVLTLQGTIAFPDIRFDYKNTFEFTPDGRMIDRWFHNAPGTWQPGHVIEFTPVE